MGSSGINAADHQVMKENIQNTGETDLTSEEGEGVSTVRQNHHQNLFKKFKNHPEEGTRGRMQHCSLLPMVAPVLTSLMAGRKNMWGISQEKDMAVGSGGMGGENRETIT